MDQAQFQKFERQTRLASVAELLSGKVTDVRPAYHGSGSAKAIGVKVEGTYAEYPVSWQLDWVKRALPADLSYHSVLLRLTPHGEEWSIEHDATAPLGWRISGVRDALHTRLVQAQIVKPIQETIMEHFPFPERGGTSQRHGEITGCLFSYEAGALTCAMVHTGTPYQGPGGEQVHALLDCLVALARIDAEVNTEAPPKRQLWPWGHRG